MFLLFINFFTFITIYLVIGLLLSALTFYAYTQNEPEDEEEDALDPLEYEIFNNNKIVIFILVTTLWLFLITFAYAQEDS